MRGDYAKLLQAADAAVTAGVASGRIGSERVFLEFAEPDGDQLVAEARIVSPEERLGRLLYFAALPDRPDEYPVSLPFLPLARVRLLETSTLPAGPVLAWAPPCDVAASVADLRAQSETEGWRHSAIAVPFPPGMTFIELSKGGTQRQIIAITLPPLDPVSPVITMGHRFSASAAR